MTCKCPKCRCYVDAVKGMFDHRCPHCKEPLQPAPDEPEPEDEEPEGWNGETC